MLGRLVRGAYLLPVLAVYLLPALYLYFTGRRFLIVSHLDRIGHLAAEPDLFLKEIALGDRERVHPILLVDPRKAANLTLVRHWGRYISIVSSGLPRKLLYPFSRFPFLRVLMHEYVGARDMTVLGPAIYAKWGDRPPLLRLETDEIKRGEQCLREMGVSEGSWFVCIHAREGGYSPSDEHQHEYRNSDIASYAAAIRTIVERGGWCIRVGDASMKSAPVMPGLIDYARSSFKSDWMDVFLCGRCRFFVGNTSGLSFMSTAFGVPCVRVNLVPLSVALPLGVHDLGIPKLLVDAAGTPIPFGRAFDSPAANFRWAKLYRAAGLWVRDNTPEEIRDVVVEMLDRLEGRFHDNPEDEALQKSFRSLLRPGHFSYGAASRIGRAFLRAHSDLLSQRSVRELVD